MPSVPVRKRLGILGNGDWVDLEGDGMGEDRSSLFLETESIFTSLW